MPKSNLPVRVFAKERPGALPLPHDRKIGAFTRPEVFDRWCESASARVPKAAANTIEMLDVIGYDWWTGGGITVESVSAQLKGFKGQDVEVLLNSPGGDMFEGIGIYNLLREHDGRVTVKVIGLAASAASVIAMAGDQIAIGAASFLMIHNCWVVAIGNRKDMQATADWLAPFDEAMAQVYADRSGRTVAECAAWMDAETYMSGSTAIERGFADSLLASDSQTADPAAKAAAHETATVRATEHALLASGMTRTQARAHINQIKGKQDAAPEAKPGAGEPDWVKGAQQLIKTIEG